MQEYFGDFREVSFHPRDMCSGKLMVEEASGIVTNFKNEPIDAFSPEMVATNGKIHDQILEVLQRSE